MKRATWFLGFVPSRICDVECPLDLLLDYGVSVMALAGRWAVAGYPGHHIVLVAS